MEEIRLTSWYGKYPIIDRVLYIPGGAEFLPSTVCHVQPFSPPLSNDGSLPLLSSIHVRKSASCTFYISPWPGKWSAKQNRLDFFWCAIFCHIYAYCWCFCCSYVISLLYWLCCFMTSWLSWLSTFKEILDITTLPIARFKKTMRKSWGIQQQSQIAADAPLLASHREAEARRLETPGIPTGASVARHQKKGGQ